jgi:thiol-disulfide isomerase/thioredoxin
MDQNLIYFSLFTLTLCTLLNLSLSLKLLRKIKQISENTKNLSPIPLGTEIPQITARTLLSKQNQDLLLPEYAIVLLFLSTKCPKCKEKLPEIEKIAMCAEQAGVQLWLVSNEPQWRVRRFLGNTALAPLAVFLKEENYREINSKLMSPYYLFIDHARLLQAEGMIGDDNWCAFLTQIEELASADQHES